MTFRTSLFTGLSLVFFAACGGQKSQEQASGSTQTPSSAAQTSAVDAATAANITGTVKFIGTKPKMDRIVMSGDAYCKTAHASTVYSDEVVVNDNNTLKFVYVYVKKGLEGKTFPVPSTPVVFDQLGCIYTPHVAAVQTKQEILVRNSDGVLHNVNAKPKNNRGFNFGQPVKGMETKKTFDNPEVMIPVKCDVHPWMHGWIGVQNHPYASVTDDKGVFSLNNLPPGTYEIEAWHEKFGTSIQTITVGAKENKTLEFTFKGA